MALMLRTNVKHHDREQTPDLLKGVAVVLMIQVHLIELFATQEVYESIVGRISLFLGGPPAAPVFMAVMGYFLAVTNKSTSELFRRGLLLIAGGILLNVGLNTHLLVFNYSGKFSLDPLAYIFGADILPLAGLSTICIALLRLIFKRSIVAFSLMTASVASVAPLLSSIEFPNNPIMTYVAPFFWGSLWWSYFPLFPWLTYPLAGYVTRMTIVRLHPLALSLKVTLAVILTFVIGFLASADYALSITANLPSYYHHGPMFAVWTIFFLVGWTALARVAEERFSQRIVMCYLKWLGCRVTASYVLQWLLIGNIATAIYKTQTLPQVALWFLLILGLTTFMVLLWEIVRKHSRVWHDG